MKVDQSEIKNNLILAQDNIKDRQRVIIIGLSASLSAIMFGYSLKEITSIPIQIIQANYGTQIDSNLLQGLLIGIMPFGGLFGSLLAKSLIKTITRLQGMHIALPILIISILFVEITDQYTLFFGRFLQGICIGYYVSIAPIYLKQITPKQLRSVTGTFFSLGKIAGVLLVILLELILGEQAWRILLSVTAILALIQSTILFFIGEDTPYEWIARKDYEKARQTIRYIYKESCVDQVFQQICNDLNLQKQKSQLNSKSEIHQSQTFARRQKTAFYMAINVCVIRHFSGGNSLITSAGIIMKPFDVSLAKWTPLSINTLQFTALIFYILVYSKVIGKRKLLIVSTGALAFVNLALVISLILKQQIMIMASITIEMIIYGGILLSAVWSYPSEIISAEQSLIPNVLHWIALSLSTLAPSLVMSMMPNNEVYPCYIFFCLYSLFTFIHFKRQAVETNGLTYEEIINKFKQW